MIIFVLFVIVPDKNIKNILNKNISTVGRLNLLNFMLKPYC
jgi:hypothetical protein